MAKALTVPNDPIESGPLTARKPAPIPGAASLKSITIGEVRSRSDIEAARSLFREYADSLPFGLRYQNFEAEPAGLPAPYVPPSGSLLLAKRGAALVGTVGLKSLHPV